MTDCSLLWEGPNGLFHWAHIVRSDRDSQHFPFPSWNDSNENSGLKIANFSEQRNFQFLMKVLNAFTIIFIISCNWNCLYLKAWTPTARCLHWMTKSGSKYCSCALLILVHEQFSDCSFSLQREEAAHTVVPLSHCCSSHWGVPDLFMVMVKSVWNVSTSLHRPAKLETFLCFPSSFAYSSAQAWQLLVECSVGTF